MQAQVMNLFCWFGHENKSSGSYVRYSEQTKGKLWRKRRRSTFEQLKSAGSASNSLHTEQLTLRCHTEEFLIFYASVVHGKMWCSDCRTVDAQVRETFTGSPSAGAVIIYVGTKPEWKAAENVFRGEPFKLTAVPTIVKIREGKEVGRLVEDDVGPGLADFVRSS
ncbi:hypothetical protein K438DRAFT_1748779 [Mycena galopus ATCC 62051]|nr:hypothetical protein K438DRAFT_1748779 [Mycena galopus ATCC 62051]